MSSMLPDAKLTELGEKILLTLWKRGSFGGNSMMQETLKAELASLGTQQDVTEDLTALRALGFLTATPSEGDNVLSLTALGLSFLRQIEEDKLQELK